MYARTLYRRQRRYTRMAPEIARLGADRRSKLKLGSLTFLILAKSRSPWRDRPVHVRVRGAGDRTIALAARTEIEVLREIYVEHEYELPSSDEPITIVDLGAHIGLAARYLATRFPNARIVAVEADPALVQQLEFNLRGLNAEVVNAAIGGAGERVQTLYRSADSWANSIHQALDWQQPVEVPGLGFDELLQRTGIEEVDLLKLDIEGAEWETFPEGIPASVLKVIGEVHSSNGEDPADRIPELTGAREFDVRRRHEKRATFLAV